MFNTTSRRLGGSLLSPARRGLATAARPRTAIVTGASRGIGKAIALRLARDGYDVCINDLPSLQKEAEQVASEIRKVDGRKACVALGDVSDRAQVDDMVRQSVRSLGALDTMVANAGIAHVKSLLDITAEDFDRLFRINVTGVHNCFAAASKQLIAQGECKPERPGKLLAAASVAGFRPMTLLGAYCATKFAVRGLVHNYAVEMAPHHITSNAYAPGIVGTDMWGLIDRELAKAAGGKRRAGEMMEKCTREGIALQRTSVPEDVSNLVSYLASRDADYVTGQTQIVDGGMVFT